MPDETHLTNQINRRQQRNGRFCYLRPTLHRFALPGAPYWGFPFRGCPQCLRGSAGIPAASGTVWCAVNQMHSLHTQQASGVLTAPEQYDFDLIVANARSSGWISDEQTLTAERSAASIIVRMNDTRDRRERCYPDGQRWMYELLHDLAHGMWK